MNENNQQIHLRQYILFYFNILAQQLLLNAFVFLQKHSSYEESKSKTIKRGKLNRTA